MTQTARKSTGDDAELMRADAGSRVQFKARRVFRAYRARKAGRLFTYSPRGLLPPENNSCAQCAARHRASHSATTHAHSGFGHSPTQQAPRIKIFD